MHVITTWKKASCSTIQSQSTDTLQHYPPYVHTHANTYTHISMRAHTLTCKHTHTHTQTRSLAHTVLLTQSCLLVWLPTQSCPHSFAHTALSSHSCLLCRCLHRYTYIVLPIGVVAYTALPTQSRPHNTFISLLHVV